MNSGARQSLGDLKHQWDAIVVGAGPAGSLMARQLAQRGRQVLLVEKKRFPRAKVCGACVNARALSALESAGLGDLTERLGGEPLSELEILADARRARVRLPPSVAVGRTEFDQALALEAVAAGATFRDGVVAKVGPVGSTCETSEVVLIHGDELPTLFSARVVIAADGLQHSCLAHDAAFASEVVTGSLMGLGTTIPADDYGLGAGLVRMVVGKNGYVGMVRLAGDRLNIAAAVATEGLREAAGPLSLVRDILHQSRVEAPNGLEVAEWQGTGALTRTTRQVAAPRLFLLGDATGYVEPFTGEGIAWALCSALRAVPLAEACIAGTATPEQLAHDWHGVHELEVRRRQAWCHRLAWVLRSPWRCRMAIVLAAAFPWLAERVAGQVNQGFVSDQLEVP